MEPQLWNRFLYNVVICPWAREGPYRSCTVPGTDNHEADTALNHAGMWALPPTNHYVGNRFANSFNGLFIQVRSPASFSRLPHALLSVCF